MKEVLRRLYEEDQADRQLPFASITPEELQKISQRDRLRRIEVREFIDSNGLVDPQDYYHAAMVFQHGETPDDFKTANNLAKKSMEMGYEPAKWLYAASYDRWLVSHGQPQKFGTQYRILENGTNQYFPIDPSTTDEERKLYNVPVPKL